MKLKSWSSPYLLWMVLFTVIPLALIFVFAFTDKSGQFSLSNFQNMGVYMPVLGRSIVLSVISTLICLLLGYPVAYILAMKVKNSTTLVMLIMLPMWMNFLLRTYAWLTILENNGLLNRLLELLHLPALQVINTPTAVAIGMVYNYLPFMILPIHSVLLKIHDSLIEAAQDLGGNSFQVFWRVTLPLSLPGIMSGILMVFMPAISTFIISKMLGGGSYLLIGDLIEMQFIGNSYNPHLGSAISLVMMLIILVIMTIVGKFGGADQEGTML